MFGNCVSFCTKFTKNWLLWDFRSTHITFISVEIILLILITMSQPYVVEDCSSVNFNRGLLVNHLELYILLNGFHFIVSRFIFDIFFSLKFLHMLMKNPLELTFGNWFLGVTIFYKRNINLIFDTNWCEIYMKLITHPKI